jgi:hypothetical protein
MQDRFPTLRTDDSEPLVELRDRAERQLNAVRALILGLLAFSAVAYSPTLTPALRLVNVSVLIPTLAWTFFQYLRWYHQPRLPAWLSIANPVVDVTAVTLSMLGYGLAQSAGLALKAPIFHLINSHCLDRQRVDRRRVFGPRDLLTFDG